MLGGSNYCTCVFDYDFEAGRAYRLRTDSVTYEVPCPAQTGPRLYSRSVEMEIVAPGSAPRMATVSTLCTAVLRLSHFCRKDEDCEGTPMLHCRPAQDSARSVGVCMPSDR